jgi:hypothetical protein
MVANFFRLKGNLCQAITASNRSDSQLVRLFHGLVLQTPMPQQKFCCQSSISPVLIINHKKSIIRTCRKECVA